FISGDQPASVQSVAKVLPLLLFIRRGQRPFCPFQAYSRRIEFGLWLLRRPILSALMLRLLGKVWPVDGPLLISSQRGKGPFGVGCNGGTLFRRLRCEKEAPAGAAG